MLAQNITRLTPEEQFVLTQLKAKGDADFTEDHPGGNVISGQFLKNLITAKSSFPINITHATIRGPLDITEVAIHVPLRFSDCTFENGIDLSYDTFDYDLTLDKGHVGLFPDSQDSARFIGIKVAALVHLRNVTFEGAVDFSRAEIGGEFMSNEVHFNSQQEADFSGLKTKAPVLFGRSTFAGGLTLADSEIYSLGIEGAPAVDGNPPDKLTLNLERASIGHGLGIHNVMLPAWDAGFLEVKGPADLENLVPAGNVDLSYSKFRILTIGNFDRWLRKDLPGSITLRGLTFDEIEIPGDKTGDPSALRLLGLFESPHYRYSPLNYLELERFLRSHGNPDKADEIYIAMRRQEMRRNPFWKWPLDVMLDALVGYGKKPWKAVFYAMGLVVVGMIIFRPGRMMHEDAVCTDNWYVSFWYSLDLLSPIDLGVSKKWRATSSVVRHYSQLHRIAGWILIPLIAAAITGIIK